MIWFVLSDALLVFAAAYIATRWAQSRCVPREALDEAWGVIANVDGHITKAPQEWPLQMSPWRESAIAWAKRWGYRR